jgi:formylglycine-generating enzyme required for sulfatase activity
MNTIPIINTAWHPLASGNPPAWASEWGQDEYGVFVAFTLEKVTQRLRWIPPGRFMMGSPEDEPGRYDDEGPQHRVYITQGFWLADTPCTQALWETVMGNNPSRFKSPRRPVEGVSWSGVQTFLQTLNDKIPGLKLCLPTEAQWEHACRARTDTALYSGPIEILGESNAPALDPIAWYGGNSGVGYELDEGYDSSDWKEIQYSNPESGTREVGQKQPNPWGLYDMIGNVLEWCADGKRMYTKETQIDPIGTMDSSAARVMRGGSWSHVARYCRSAYRYYNGPVYQSHNFGFRCARVQS